MAFQDTIGLTLNWPQWKSQNHLIYYKLFSFLLTEILTTCQIQINYKSYVIKIQSDDV
jgi:hypothetical protein